jgi:hypothetical protein
MSWTIVTSLISPGIRSLLGCSRLLFVLVVSAQRLASFVKFGLGDESATTQDVFQCGQPSLTAKAAVCVTTR